MKVIKGNLLDLAEQGQFDVILHGANCFCTMKSGIAGEIANRYPEVVLADKKTVAGDNGKLGSLTVARVTRANFSFMVVNMYTQYDYGRHKSIQYADYGAIRKALSLLTFRLRFVDMLDVRIGYPKFGAGLANGDWNIISKIIEEELKDFDHTLVVLED